jgi:MFS family permease
MAEGVPNRRLWLTAGANIGVAAALLPAFAIHTFPPTVPLFLLAGIGLGLPMAPQQAMSLDIVVPRLRGRAAALRSVVRAGMTALAPLVFGVLSDHLGLRAAFLIVTPCMVLSAGLTLLALRTYVPDMERAQSEALRQHRLEDDSTR